MQEKNSRLFDVKQWLAGVLKTDKKVKLIVAVGVIGIALILLSELIVPPKDAKNAAQPANDSLTSDHEKLERQVYDLITSIQGVGRAKVMVTLETSVEYIYAKEQKTDEDVARNSKGEDTQTFTQKQKTEESYILVDGSAGKQALLTTEKAPRVKGVVVVCEGGDDRLVQTRIVDALTTAFDIGANRVCVTQMAPKGS